LNLTTATAVVLNRGASYCSITAKYAAIPFFRFKDCLAVFALIEKLASISRHCFFLLMPTLRASND
jgi:hypothetical protein